MSNQPSIAFVIPHRGRIELLKKTVASILAQSDSTCTLDITVVIVTQDNDLTLDFPGLPAGRTCRIVRREAGLTIAALRNAGVAESSSEYLAFIDADMELSPGWTAAMLVELEGDSRRIIVSACEKMPVDPTPIEKIRVLLNKRTGDTDVPFMTGRNLFLRRESFERIGPFPEHLATAEDYFFTGRASESGKLFCSTKAFVIHLGEDKKFGDMFVKEIWRSRSNYHSLQNRRIPLSEVPSLIAPLCAASVVPMVLCIGCFALPPVTLLIPAGFFLLPVIAYALRCGRICGRQVAWIHILLFYLTYFAARGAGVFRGIIDRASRRG
jgi:glycosyltransferase involved in cell wall biosynthesis